MLNEIHSDELHLVGKFQKQPPQQQPQQQQPLPHQQPHRQPQYVPPTASDGKKLACETMLASDVQQRKGFGNDGRLVPGTGRTIIGLQNSGHIGLAIDERKKNIGLQDDALASHRVNKIGFTDNDASGNYEN